MAPLQIVTLFQEAPAPRRMPSAAALSMATHALVLGLSALVFSHKVQLSDQLAPSRYTVRLIRMALPALRREPMPQQRGASGARTPLAPGAVQTPTPRQETSADAGSDVPQLPGIERPAHAAQTLVQPDLPPDLLARNVVPLPQVIVWSASHTVVTTITPPPPFPVNTPVVRRSFETPVDAPRVADLRLSPETFGASRLTLPASTTTPLVVRRPAEPVHVPTTASLDAAMATPARVISLSSVRMESGTITLPPLQAIGTVTGTGDANAGPSGMGGSGAGDSGTSGKGAGQGTGTGPGPSSDGTAEGGGAPSGDGAHALRAGNGGPSPESGAPVSGGGEGDLEGMRLTELRQPMDGEFNSVVIGSSIAERYPETMQLWAGRLAYTVYLHMGLPKNWILQYAIPREATHPGGDAAQPNAPWPYLMERPRLLAADFTSDALMIHGKLNTAGRFEAMSVLFPSDFPQSHFVLSALEQWRFRPARQNGRLIAVEVLLIIPEAD